MQTDEYVLITGASSGIGLEMAREFARHRHPLILVAPVETELEVIASTLRDKYDVPVAIIACDLSDEWAPDHVYQQITTSDLTVGILVNNAGFGVRGRFQDIPLDSDIGMIRLNAEAGVRLTKLFLPSMLQHQRGKILNTASIAGFQPGPLLAVYHATKAFMLSLSESLATELEDTGVTVTALCPGPVDTDFFPKAGMVETRAFQKANVMSPQEVALAAYEAVMAGERLVVPGATNKAMAFSRRLTPESTQAKANQKLYEDVAPDEHQREPGEIAAKAEATLSQRR